MGLRDVGLVLSFFGKIEVNYAGSRPSFKLRTMYICTTVNYVIDLYRAKEDVDSYLRELSKVFRRVWQSFLSECRLLSVGKFILSHTYQPLIV